MEQYGNTTTFNIESVLHKNIKDGEYFNKTCVKLTTFEELVDEARLIVHGTIYPQSQVLIAREMCTKTHLRSFTLAHSAIAVSDVFPPPPDILLGPKRGTLDERQRTWRLVGLLPPLPTSTTETD